MFHRHVWKVVSRDARKGFVTQAVEKGAELKGDWLTLVEGRDYELVHYRCETCGSEKVDRV